MRFLTLSMQVHSFPRQLSGKRKTKSFRRSTTNSITRPFLKWLMINKHVFGCKGKNKFWYGYKKHVSMDMQTGLINKVALTPANTTDGQGFKLVCPSGGAVYADKAYCGASCQRTSTANGCYLSAIRKNNMKDKNRDLDKWRSHIRSPYERVFSKQRKRTRYRGIVKNQFSCFMESICFNFKRLIVLDVKGLCLN